MLCQERDWLYAFDHFHFLQLILGRRFRIDMTATFLYGDQIFEGQENGPRESKANVG